MRISWFWMLEKIVGEGMDYQLEMLGRKMRVNGLILGIVRIVLLWKSLISTLRILLSFKTRFQAILSRKLSWLRRSNPSGILRIIIRRKQKKRRFKMNRIKSFKERFQSLKNRKFSRLVLDQFWMRLLRRNFKV